MRSETFEYCKGNISSTQTIEKQYTTIANAKSYTCSLSGCIGFCLESAKRLSFSKEYLIHFKSGKETFQEYGEWHTFLLNQQQNLKDAVSKEFCQSAINDVCTKISLKFPDYPQFESLFRAKCIEEAFEEIDLLIEDVSEGFDNSVILEEISETLKIEETDREPLCQSIHYILSTFCPPPTTLNLCQIGIKIKKNEISEMMNKISEQAAMLKPENNKDEALINLLVIGQKNHFSLLTYLVDTYARYRLLEYELLYNELNKIETKKKRIKYAAKKFKNTMELSTFFKKCPIMNDLQHRKKRNKNAEHKLLWFDSSIKSFHRRLFGPLKVEPNQIMNKINDSMVIYAKYYVAMLKTVTNMIKNSNTKLPMQIDFWLIPKAMSSNENNEWNGNNEDMDNEIDIESDDQISTDDDDEKMDEMDEKNTNILRLEQRLKFVDNLAVDEVDSGLDVSRMSRKIGAICNDVINGQRSKRMVLIVDRRSNVKNDGKKDKMYGYLPKNSQNIPSGSYLHESMFNLSRTELLPSTKKEDDALHVLSMDVPNLCVLSIHIHEENVVRAYWHINGSASRFFVNDIVNVLPLYFVENERKNIEKIKSLIKENADSMPLKDGLFDSFFETSTKIKPNQAYFKRIL